MNIKPNFEGIHKLYGDNFTNILDKHILIIGVGGVGSWCAEFLARSGVQKFTFVDIDDICSTNINRQIMALESNIGKFKIDELKKRVLQINSSCEVNLIHDFFTKESAQKILTPHYDYIIDACDSIKNKAILYSMCKKKNLKLILSGGAGGKYNLEQIFIKNFNRAHNDSMISRMRTELKRNHKDLKDHNPEFKAMCVFSTEYHKIENNNGGKVNCRGILGSSGIMTSAFALKMSNHVLHELIGHE
ncbi:MAG: tRNA threonylcarbamoyladenosine dehydratase [Bacteriovoracaceae bacterium]|nr:tRNA threonylcarbamoyladenosine dehydratase [Bacteriovoracaceae bacterium]